MQEKPNSCNEEKGVQHSYERANEIFECLVQCYKTLHTGGHVMKEEHELKLKYDEIIVKWSKSHSSIVYEHLHPYVQALKIRTGTLAKMKIRKNIDLPPTDNQNSYESWDTLFNTMITRMCVDKSYIQTGNVSPNPKEMSKPLFSDTNIPELFLANRNDEVLSNGVLKYACLGHPKDINGWVEEFRNKYYELFEKYKDDIYITRGIVRNACQYNSKNPEKRIEEFKRNLLRLLEKYGDDGSLSKGDIRQICHVNRKAPDDGVRRLKKEIEKLQKRFGQVRER